MVGNRRINTGLAIPGAAALAPADDANQHSLIADISEERPAAVAPTGGLAGLAGTNHPGMDARLGLVAARQLDRLVARQGLTGIGRNHLEVHLHQHGIGKVSVGGKGEIIPASDCLVAGDHTAPPGRKYITLIGRTLR